MSLVSLGLMVLALLTPPPAEVLTGQLGCFNCHPGGDASDLRTRLPDLASMGARYRRDHLEKALTEVRRSRPDLGAARMPRFPMEARERAAVAAWLSTQRRLAPGPRVPTLDAPVGRGSEVFESTCVPCHDGRAAADLSEVARRLRKPWVERFLVDPARFSPGSTMPPLFYRRTKDGYEPTGPGAARRLAAVVTYLFDGALPEPAPAETAGGERMVRSLRCAACHSGEAVPRDAPDLAIEGLRVKPDWLRAFLRSPRPVRPFGARPGHGGRMPDFGLTGDEVAAVAGFVEGLAGGRALPSAPRPPKTLSAFSKLKAQRFLTEKLSCLGCHALDGAGGRMAPDLAEAGRRLRPAYLYGMLTDPGGTAPGTLMPHIPPRPNVRTTWLLYDDLAGRTGAPETRYISPLETPEPPAEGTGPAGLYAERCASCHGATGGGDGYNARFLPQPPTRFDTALARRADDTLFDAISVGGFVLGRSHRMPPWGHTLSAEQIRGLVGHLRTLCKCEQPGWAAP